MIWSNIWFCRLWKFKIYHRRPKNTGFFSGVFFNIILSPFDFIACRMICFEISLARRSRVSFVTSDWFNILNQSDVTNDTRERRASEISKQIILQAYEIKWRQDYIEKNPGKKPRIFGPPMNIHAWCTSRAKYKVQNQNILVYVLSYKHASWKT